jgi:hypothetical protein
MNSIFKLAMAALSIACLAPAASAQQYAAYGSSSYRVCPVSQTTEGLSVVQQQCGDLRRPDFTAISFSSVAELEAARIKREAFTTEVSAYNRCVSAFINAFRRPGAPADSAAPDQAACAHSWAEDQATQSVREYGKACIEFSNRSMIDAALQPWSGECYPSLGKNQG